MPYKHPFPLILRHARGRYVFKQRRQSGTQLQQLLDYAHQLGFKAPILTDELLVTTDGQLSLMATQKPLVAVRAHKRKHPSKISCIRGLS